MVDDNIRNSVLQRFALGGNLTKRVSNRVIEESVEQEEQPTKETGIKDRTSDVQPLDLREALSEVLTIKNNDDEIDRKAIQGVRRTIFEKVDKNVMNDMLKSLL